MAFKKVSKGNDVAAWISPSVGTCLTMTRDSFVENDKGKFVFGKLVSEAPGRYADAIVDAVENIPVGTSVGCPIPSFASDIKEYPQGTVFRITWGKKIETKKGREAWTGILEVETNEEIPF